MIQGLETVKFSLVRPEVISLHDFRRSAMYDNAFVAIEDNHCHHAIVGQKEAYIVSLDLGVFEPGEGLWHWLQHGSLPQLDNIFGTFIKNRRRPNTNKKLSVESVGMDAVLDDPAFVPLPFYRNVMFKASPDKTTVTALRPNSSSAIVVDIPSGLMAPKFVNDGLLVANSKIQSFKQFMVKLGCRAAIGGSIAWASYSAYSSLFRDNALAESIEALITSSILF